MRTSPGTGVEDVLSVATSVDDPSVDRLVVLHGDGTASSLGRLGGFGRFEDETGPYVAMIFWEKAVDRYRWDGDTFSLFENPDACCWSALLGAASVRTRG